MRDYYFIRIILDNIFELPREKAFNILLEVERKCEEDIVLRDLLEEVKSTIAFYHEETNDEEFLEFFSLSYEDLLKICEMYHFEFRRNVLLLKPPLIRVNSMEWMENVKRFIENIFYRFLEEAKRLFGLDIDVKLVFDYRITGSFAASLNDEIVVFGDLLPLCVEGKNFEKRIPQTIIEGVVSHEIFHVFFSKVLGELEHLYRLKFVSTYCYHEFIAEIGKFFLTRDPLYFLVNSLESLFKCCLEICCRKGFEKAIRIASLYDPTYYLRILGRELTAKEFINIVYEMLYSFSTLYAFLKSKEARKYIKKNTFTRLLKEKRPLSVFKEALKHVIKRVKKGEVILYESKCYFKREHSKDRTTNKIFSILNIRKTGHCDSFLPVFREHFKTFCIL